MTSRLKSNCKSSNFDIGSAPLVCVRSSFVVIHYSCCTYLDAAHSGTSGTNDSGWHLLSNGSYVRRKSSWQSQSSESSYGGAKALTEAELAELHKQLASQNEVLEHGDLGKNSTGKQGRGIKKFSL